MPDPAVRRVSGIVLAGGRATRFGGDKLSAAVQGRALVEYPIATLSTVCAEVVVVIGPADAPPQMRSTAAPVRIARDNTTHAGPMAGLVAGLESARNPVVVVVAGDMPAMVADVLVVLALRVEEGGAAAALMEGASIRPLPCALRRTVALARARQLPRGSGVRDLLARLDLRPIPEEEWRSLDPDARTLLDVDTREDLERLPADLS